MKNLFKNLWDNVDIYIPIYLGLEILANLIWVRNGGDSFIGTWDMLFYGLTFVFIGILEWVRKEKSE